jgi:hypothetical protein
MKNENILRIFEIRILRKINGNLGKIEYTYGCQGTIIELYKLYNEPNIMKVTKGGRLICLGQLFRVQEQNLSRTADAATCSRWFLDRRFFYPEYGGDNTLRNFGSHKIYTEPHPRRRLSSAFGCLHDEYVGFVFDI